MSTTRNANVEISHPLSFVHNTTRINAVDDLAWELSLEKAWSAGRKVLEPWNSQVTTTHNAPCLGAKQQRKPT